MYPPNPTRNMTTGERGKGEIADKGGEVQQEMRFIKNER